MATDPQSEAGRAGVPGRVAVKSSHRGAVITGIISLGALAAIGATFVLNASPYVDVQGAVHSQGDNLHLAGNILKPTLHSNYASRTINFTIEDVHGERLPVVYNGEAISNIGEAEKVVAIGGMQRDGVFHSTKLLIKCPSKYGDSKLKEDAKAASGAGYSANETASTPRKGY